MLFILTWTGIFVTLTFVDPSAALITMGWLVGLGKHEAVVSGTVSAAKVNNALP
jgi:hypothetical protein